MGLLCLLLASCLLPVRAYADAIISDCSEGGLLDAISSGGDVIFDEDCDITISGTIVINQDNLTLDANDYTVDIDGNGVGPMFYVAPGVQNFTLSGLSIHGGVGANTNGAVLYISQGASVLLTNCVIASNSVSGDSGDNGNPGNSSDQSDGSDGKNGVGGISVSGGAIYNLGNLTILNSQFISNSATAGSGGNGGDGGNGGGTLSKGGDGGNGGKGASSYGGAIFNAGYLIASNSLFSSNLVVAGDAGSPSTNGTPATGAVPGAGAVGGSSYGAGIYSSSNLVLLNCSFLLNQAIAGNSTAGGNDSGGSGEDGNNGGGAFGAGVCALTNFAATNCTFYSNVVVGGSAGNGGTASKLNTQRGGDGGDGGKAYGGAIFSSGTGSVLHCTIARCLAIGGTNGTAGAGRGGINGYQGMAQGAGILSAGGRFWIANSLFATNLVSGTTNGYKTNFAVLGGTCVDAGYNLTNDTGSSFNNKTDIRKVAIYVYPTPANNGGYTATLALTNGSPAIDAIPTTTSNAFLAATDQRGVPRAQGNGTDIGAFELATGPVVLVNPTDLRKRYQDSGTFYVSASGPSGPNLSLSYQWRINGTNIRSAQGSGFSSYTLTNIVATNGGLYDVVVSCGGHSVTSLTARLTVAPYITNYSFITNAPEAWLGDTTNIWVATASSGSSNDVPVYHWYTNDTTYPLLVDNGSILGTSGTNLTIQIGTNISSTNLALSYAMIASNSAGSVTSEWANLTVDAILTQPTNIITLLSNTVTFYVQAQGNNLTYQWRTNGVAIQSTPVANLQSYPFTVLSTTPITYDAVVYNSVGVYRRTVPATLTVVTTPPTTPTLTPSATSLTFTQGQSTNLAVTLAAGEGLTYQWFRNGSALTNATNAVLSFTPVQYSDAGTYSVAVSNLMGFATSSSLAVSVVLPDLALTNTPGIWQTNGYLATGVAVSGNYAYLTLVQTNSTSGLLAVLDISNTNAPHLLTTLPLPSPLAVAVSEPSAYVACGTNGLYVLNVLTPATASILTTCALTAEDVVVTNSIAYLACGSNGLQLLDVSQPLSPVSLGSFATAAACHVAVSAPTVWLADAQQGLLGINTSNSNAPSLLTSPISSGVTALTLGPSCVYTVLTNGELEIVSTPDYTVFDATNLGSRVSDLSFVANYLFAANNTNGLAAFNATNALQPLFLTNDTAAGPVRALAPAGHLLYAAASNGLWAFDLGAAADQAIDFGPQILTQPQSQPSATNGQTVLLSATVSGTPPLSYQWFWNGSILAGATNANLAFAPVVWSNAGSYQLIVTNGSGSATSVVATLALPCSYNLPISETNVGPQPFSGTFDITSFGNCGWYVDEYSSDSDWLIVTPTTGTGSGTISFTATANTDTLDSRQGTITVYDADDNDVAYYTVTQSGNSWLLSLSASTYTDLYYAPDDDSVIEDQGDGTFLCQRGATIYLLATNVADDGEIFQDWEYQDGTLFSTNPAISLSMTMDYNLFARYGLPTAFVAGTYRGLFSPATNAAQENCGGVTLTTTAKGNVSGNLQIGSARYSISGKMNAFGYWEKTLTSAHHSNLVTTLQLATSDEGFSTITGTVVCLNPAWTADLTTYLGLTNKQTTSLQGLYTLLIPGVSDASSNQPGGDSWATMKVNANGSLSMSGSMADGTAYTLSSALSQNGLLPLYVSLYSGSGSLFSWITFTNDIDQTNAFAAALSWLRPQQPKSKYYTSNEFALQTNIVGSFYAAPQKKMPLLNFTNALIVLSGGNLASPLTNPVTITTQNTVKSTNKASLTFKTAAGTFSGKVLNPATAKFLSFSGVLLTNRAVNSGYFLGTNQSGRVEIVPAAN